VCEEWLISTSNLKSNSISNVKRYSSPHQMWTVIPLHTKFEKWLLYIKCEEWLLFTSNLKSDSSPHQMWSETSLQFKCEEWLLSTSNVKWNLSSIQMWRVTPLHINCEELLLSTGNDSSPHKSVSSPQIWRVTPHDSSAYQMWSDSSLPIRSYSKRMQHEK
jgi:hypothetical protein